MSAPSSHPGRRSGSPLPGATRAPAERRPPGPSACTAESCAGSAPIGWSLEEVSFRYPGAARDAVEEISLDIEPGRLTAVLGPNGSGKSTLLKVLLRLVSPDRGAIYLGSNRLTAWRRRDIARLIGVVPQSEALLFPVRVRELISMGRYPHLGALRPAGARDRQIVDRAMELCNVAHLADRPMATLSGGERQRARIARALSQEPAILVLDEPTRALDLGHEMEIIELVHSMAGQGTTVLIVTHHLNLAARYADEIVLMEDGRIAAAGPPGKILSRELLERIYQWPLRLDHYPGSGPHAGAIQIAPLARAEAREWASTAESTCKD